ncbi:MAG: hypothetical protein ACOYK8_07785 [Alphaproteobacteria bacterium]
MMSSSIILSDKFNSSFSQNLTAQESVLLAYLPSHINADLIAKLQELSITDIEHITTALLQSGKGKKALH